MFAPKDVVRSRFSPRFLLSVGFHVHVGFRLIRLSALDHVDFHAIYVFPSQSCGVSYTIDNFQKIMKGIDQT